MTGIDRVEHAYLGRLLSNDTPLFGLVRSAIGFLLLDRVGLNALYHGTVDQSRSDLISRIMWRKDPFRARTETGLRRLAVARIPRPLLAKVLQRRLPAGSSYLNVGHANLDSRTLKQIHRAGLRIAVMLHDTIPLDYPEFARPDTVAPFHRKVTAVAHHADLVIHTSHDARTKTEAHLRQIGRIPPGIVANLGITLTAPGGLPFVPAPPYFVILGTIEPRKNHALLLKIWRDLPDPPPLYIVGSRGWSNAAVTSQLDALPAHSPVHELSGLPDAAVAQLLQGARALLFPSFAEGYGLPALEAIALGTPVIASNLAVFHELLGEFAVYLNPADSYSWMETISQMARTEKTGQNRKILPSWAEHFRLVLSKV